jgi:hypothetical protein
MIQLRVLAQTDVSLFTNTYALTSYQVGKLEDIIATVLNGRVMKIITHQCLASGFINAWSFIFTAPYV